ncbi:MAG: flagellin, partial [Deltaproteobacteria bacterium]|nr:flagellin [Deltaproteobacteria bacterium]
MGDISLTAGMRSNLFHLQQTSKMMETSQTRLATGLRVQSALDDPVAFFKAQEHKQRAGDLAARKDEMSEAVGTVNAANNGIEAITDLIDAAKSLAQSAQSESNSTDRATLATQFNAMLTQINNLSNDSGYKGVNLLNGSSDTLVVTFDADGTNKLTLTGFDSEVGTAGLSITSATSWTTSSVGNAATVITQLDSAKNELRTETQKLSNNLSIITARQDFTDKMINTLEDGASALTNADMNEEGANMLMLQTRQALGTTSLSMASEAAQAV